MGKLFPGGSLTENSEKLFSPIIKSIAYENTRYQESMAYRLFQSFQYLSILHESQYCCDYDMLNTHNVLSFS